MYLTCQKWVRHYRFGILVIHGCGWTTINEFMILEWWYGALLLFSRHAMTYVIPIIRPMVYLLNSMGTTKTPKTYHTIRLWNMYCIFLSKVNIGNVNCARATAFIFDTRTDVLVKVSKFLRQKMSRPEGDSNPQPSDSCRMLKPFELSWPDICCPMFLNTGPGGIDISKVKLTFEMLTVCGQQHSVLTHERMFLWKCQRFWDRKCPDLRGTRTPNLRIHAERSNHMSFQGQTIAVPCFWTLALVV